MMCAILPGARSPSQKEEVQKETSGLTAYLNSKENGDNSMPLKREVSEDADDTVPQDPCDTVRAILPEPQSPAMKANIPRPQRLMSGPCDRAAKSSSLELSAQWAVRSDLTEGDG
jgi:hypothetical protein